MRAVNLIPAEERRNAGGAAGRSGGLAYVLIGALTALVAMVALFATTSHTANTKRDKAAALERQAQSTEQQATSMQDYTAFSKLSKDRIATIDQIAESRFDWAHVMREVARTIPDGVHLTSLKGDVNGADAGSGDAASGTATSTGPSITIGGCAKGDQKTLAKVMVALRQVDGVNDVVLHSSTDPDSGGGAVAAEPGACAGPTFELVTSFDPPAVPAPTTSTTTP